jgi:citrate synthase
MLSSSEARVPGTPSGQVHFGLEGVIVADTRLSDVDGEQGRLTIAGFSLERLVETHSLEGVVSLLLAGRSPTPSEAERVRLLLGQARVRVHAWLSERRALLSSADCMVTLRAALAAFELRAAPELESTLELAALAGVATAHWVRERLGAPLLEPDPELGHAADLLRLMRGALPSARAARAFDTYLMTVSDHGMNASTFTARVVASTGSDLVSAVTAAVGALKGPLHGGAPGPVLAMLEAIGTASAAQSWLERELAAGRRIMGMGHRVYRVRDPRAQVLENALRTLAFEDPDVDARIALARAVETEAELLLNARAKGRVLKANVEFFTAVLLDGLQIPRQAFSGVFAAGRMAGWCAHFYEQQASNRLVRPSSRYVGPAPEPA